MRINIIDLIKILFSIIGTFELKKTPLDSDLNEQFVYRLLGFRNHPASSVEQELYAKDALIPNES